MRNVAFAPTTFRRAPVRLREVSYGVWVASCSISIGSDSVSIASYGVWIISYGVLAASYRVAEGSYDSKRRRAPGPRPLHCPHRRRSIAAFFRLWTSELFAQTTVSSPVTVGNRRRLDGDLFKPLAYEETPDRAARLLDVWGRADNNFVEFQRLIWVGNGHTIVGNER